MMARPKVHLFSALKGTLIYFYIFAFWAYQSKKTRRIPFPEKEPVSLLSLATSMITQKNLWPFLVSSPLYTYYLSPPAWSLYPFLDTFSLSTHSALLSLPFPQQLISCFLLLSDTSRLCFLGPFIPSTILTPLLSSYILAFWAYCIQRMKSLPGWFKRFMSHNFLVIFLIPFPP